MPLPAYDRHRTYDWNYEHVPGPVALELPAIPGSWDYCGLPAPSPLGIAAGPLLNGKWIHYYASLGFDVLTYKTVRSRERPSYDLPNLLPIAPAPLQSSGTTVQSAREMLGSWAVSFGMPSRSPELWRKDIERTRAALPREKILSVSVVATPQPGWTLEDLAADFALCARWAIESGADCVEANFSCPNVASPDAQLFQQPEAARFVAARLRKSVGLKPLLIKVGHIPDESAANALINALSPHVNALVMVNCISARVLNDSGKPAFEGAQRGIAGSAIYDAALSQIRLFRGVIDSEGSALRLVGVGGISNTAQVRAHLAGGSHAVQLATSAMLDPCIAQRIRAEFA